jgi:alpha-tubulin suppressor-like RCC1 family protein
MSLLLAAAMSVSSAAGAMDTVRSAATTPAGATASTTASTTADDTAGCSDLLFVGVPGNAQGGGGTGPEALGPVLGGIHSAYAARAATAARSLTSVTLPGMTRPASDLLPPAAAGRADKQVTPARVRVWRGALNGRIGALTTLLRDSSASCPDQLVTLTGHAQGSMVAGRALRRLAAEPGVLRHVVATALVADADHTGHRKRTFGAPAATSGAGISTLLKAPVPAPLSAIPGTRVWEVCTANDLVCDLNRTGVVTATKVHGSYATAVGAPALGSAAAKLWKRTAMWPVPLSRTTQLTAEVGQSVTLQLTARIASGHEADVAWGQATGLPPGLTLTEQGLLQGTPTAAGTWTVDYRVLNRSSAEFQPGLPGSVEVTVSTSSVAGVTVGSGHTCEVRADHTAWCWGDNSFGQLGIKSVLSTSTKKQIGAATNWAQLSAGSATTCGVRTTGTLWCWGLNHRGQVGDETVIRRKSPQQVGADTDWRSVSTGATHACAVKEDGSAWCWGGNDAGQLGNGGLKRATLPVRLQGGGSWSVVSAGGWHTCGVRTDGSAWCWGRNILGEVGDGTFVRRATPVRVGASNSWVGISTSWTHTCGVVASGVARCWGMNVKGQLGDGTIASSPNPVKVQTDETFTQVAAGDGYSCGVSRAGTLSCWGNNRYGQFGTGSRDESRTPRAVAAAQWSSISVGAWSSCALLSTGGTRCWGNNETGQVGDGTTADRLAPTEPRKG